MIRRTGMARCRRPARRLRTHVNQPGGSWYGASGFTP